MSPRRWSIAAALAAGGALAAPAAAAPPVSVHVPGFPDAITYANGRVVWVSHATRGPLVVRQVPVSGGPLAVVATIPRHDVEDGLEASLAATATGFVLAVREDGGRDLVVHGGYDGSLRTLVDCTPNPAPDNEPLLTAVAGAVGFAFAGASCGVSSPVEIVAANGAATPVPSIDLAESYGLAYAEPHLAVTVGATSVFGDVHVMNLADGTHRDLPLTSADAGSMLAALPDGTLFLGPALDGIGSAGFSALKVWAPHGARPAVATRNIAGGILAAGGGHVLFTLRRPLRGHLGLAVAGVGGGPIAPVGAPGAGFPRLPLAVDATSAVFANTSCEGRLLVTRVDLSAGSGGADGCPVRLDRARVRFGRSARTTIRVRCPNGCRTDLTLTQEPSRRRPCPRPPFTAEGVVGPYCPAVATARLRLAPSGRARRVPLRLTPAGRDIRRHHRGMRVEASITEDALPGPELVGSTVRTILFGPAGG